MSAADPHVEQLRAELELELEQLQLEREEFRKFVKPAMHAFAKCIPDMPLFVQQQHRTLQAAELEHLVRVVHVAGDYGVAGVDAEKLKARIAHLVAQVARP